MPSAKNAWRFARECKILGSTYVRKFDDDALETRLLLEQNIGTTTWLDVLHAFETLSEPRIAAWHAHEVDHKAVPRLLLPATSTPGVRGLHFVEKLGRTACGSTSLVHATRPARWSNSE